MKATPDPKDLMAKPLPGGKWAVFDAKNGDTVETHDDEMKAKRSIMRARRISQQTEIP
jgi:hypothetical protein